MKLIKMKLSICCLLCFVQIVFGSQEWNDFKTTHEKVYKNEAEENFRKYIFLKNLQLIEEHNKKYEQGLITYKLGVTKFADLAREERLHYSNTGASHVPEAAKVEPKGIFLPNEDVPESIDWRDYGVITPVTDQAWCNTCWAFAIVGTVEAHMGIHRGENVSLSQQNLEECVDPTFTCEQAMPRDMLDRTYQYIVDNNGIDSYISYPFDYVINTCHFNSSTVSARISGYGSVTEGDEEELKRVIGTIGPVTAAITTNYDFDLYQRGVYYNENCMDTTDIFNHAVLVVGYGNEDGEDYWLVRNSWGTWFGEEGYIKMARNRDNNCGIASIVRYPLM